MKRILPILIIICMALGFAGASSSCGVVDEPTLRDTLKESSQKIAQNQQVLDKLQPAPTINYSNERANLIKRATTFNEPNKVSYIYLFTKAGTVAGFYPVKGKVSSISSYLVPDEQIVKDPYTRALLTVQAPDIDGSYGTNGGGIFFYTTDNIYVEWNGDYLLCDQPLKLATQPILTREIK
jgi:hypothetical protein